MAQALEHYAEGTSWTGRSGRRYSLVRNLDKGFVPGLVYAVVRLGRISWVGMAADIIDDQFSRARFRQALAEGGEIFSFEAPADPVLGMTVVWDLEGSSREERALSAA